MLINKYMCVMTNFFNHKSTPRTTIEGLNNLRQMIISYGCTGIIIDTRYYFKLCDCLNKNIEWCERLFDIADSLDIPVMIGSYHVQNCYESELFDVNKFKFMQYGYDRILWHDNRLVFYEENKVYKNFYDYIKGVVNK